MSMTDKISGIPAGAAVDETEAPPPELGRQWYELASEAVRLSDAKFLQIYALLEQLGGRAGVTAAFDALRPRLAALRPPRRLNASRLFFQPAEDLFDDPASYVRGLGRVSRTTLPIAWRQMRDRMGPARVADFERAVAACDPRNEQQLYQTGLPLWDLGVRHLYALTEEVDRNLRLRALTFGRDEDVMEQLRTLCNIIALAPEIEELKQRLPARPIGELSQSQRAAARALLARLGADDPRAIIPVLLVLAARMRRPGDALGLLDGLELGQEKEEMEALKRTMSKSMVTQLLTQAERAETDDGRDAAHLAASAERLAEGLVSLSDAVNALRDTKIAGTVTAARTSIGRMVVRRVLPDASQRLARALFAGSGGATSARMKEAEEVALVIRRMSRLGAALGVQRDVSQTISGLRDEMEPHLHTLLRDDRPVEQDAQRQVYNIIRIVEVLSGPDEAERLYRDCKRRGLPAPTA